MFETLQAQPADKILALMQMYKDDPRETKIDLGVGVYKDATGLTPIMRAVKSAEHQLWENQNSKAYTGLAGDPAFADAMISMVLGDAIARGWVGGLCRCNDLHGAWGRNCTGLHRRRSHARWHRGHSPSIRTDQDGPPPS